MGASYMIEDQIPEIKRNVWVDNVFRPILITAMIMAFNISLVNLIRLINPTWRGYYFLAGMLLTTVEAIFSYRVLKHWRERGTSPQRYRLAEIGLLIIILKLLSFGDKSAAQIGLELQLLWQNPSSFLNVEFYWVLCLAAFAWMMATYTMADFESLYDSYTFRSDHIAPMSHLAIRFYWGGALLVAISGLGYWIARIDIAGLADLQRPSVSGIILNVLVYFIFGLVLLSQANLTRLMVRWRVQKVEVEPGLVKQWAKYALVFLLIAAFGVFFLPTNYTLGFLTSSAILISYVLETVMFVLRLLLFLFILPFAWLFSFLDSGAPATGAGGGPPPLPQFTPLEATSPNAWLEALKSFVFWILILGILIYFTRVYLNDHPELLKALKRFQPLRLLFNVLELLWGQLMGLARTGLEALPKNLGLGKKNGYTPKRGLGELARAQSFAPRAGAVLLS